MLAESLYGESEVPPAVLLALGQTRRELGLKLLAPARVRDGEPPDLSKLDPVTRVEGRTHLLEAAGAYMRHARAMILTDDGAYGDSLWTAGACFDQAGELDRAIGVFSEFVAGRPSDPRRAGAELRLGFAHMARGDYTIAEQFFQGLVAAAPKTGEAAQAVVPLAQCYQLDENPDNDEEAERLLAGVIGGRSLEPEAVEFRNALVALGELKLRSGDFDEAIRRLAEAVERFPKDEEVDRLRYKLGEAYRKSAGAIDRAMGEAMPESQRRAAGKDRDDRLRAAMELYEQVHSALEARDGSKLSAMERLHLRNATFARADCAFDLGDYDAAIRLYDAAAQRYASDPSSLVAMIQIVNAYVAKGALREARTANERARQRLAQLPDSVFESGDLPLDRRRLEQWLESSARLSSAQGTPE
jgi:tetratricopeptide (TPR) repeat protein